MLLSASAGSSTQPTRPRGGQHVATTCRVRAVGTGTRAVNAGPAVEDPTSSRGAVRPRSPGDVADLLVRARRGDAAAWNGLVTQLSGLLWSVARAHRLPDSDCADVVQSTWVRLLENLDAVRDPERLPGWLATTARRECLRTLKRSGKVSPLDQLAVSDLPDEQLEPLDAALLQQERDLQLWQAFAQLPAGCQALLRLLLAEPAPSYEDVAAALGRPLGAIGPTRGRCLRRLRRVLEQVAGPARLGQEEGERR